MVDPTLFQILATIWKWLVAPVAVVAWWLYRKREAAMDDKFLSTDNKLKDLETRMIQVEKTNTVIEYMINDIRQDNVEIKAILNKLNDRLLK